MNIFQEQWAEEAENKRRMENKYDKSQGNDYHDYISHDLTASEQQKKVVYRNGGMLPDIFHVSCMEKYLSADKILRLNHELADYLIGEAKQRIVTSNIKRKFNKPPRIDQTYMFLYKKQETLVVSGLDESGLHTLMVNFLSKMHSTCKSLILTKKNSYLLLTTLLQQHIYLFESHYHILWNYMVYLGGFKLGLLHKFAVFLHNSARIFLATADADLSSRVSYDFSYMDNPSNAPSELFDNLVYGTWYSTAIIGLTCCCFTKATTIKTTSTIIKQIYRKLIQSYTDKALNDHSLHYYDY